MRKRLALPGMLTIVACVSTAPDRSTTAPAPAPAPAEAAPAVVVRAPGPPPRNAHSHPPVDALSRALLERLTVWTRADGTRVLAQHCRIGPISCEDRVVAFARFFVAEATERALDPALLAAIAVRESNLDPAAVGRVGTRGIMQLHPRGVGRGQRFVEDAAYRRQCLERVDACQRAIVARAAEAIAESLKRCGSLRAALGRYATGQCRDVPPYVAKVEAEWHRLQRATEQLASE